jgi:hypothetical protein
MRVILLLVIFSLCIFAGEAITYQVGPTRSFKTVSSLPALNPGDVVEIDSSTYNEVKRWTRAGTATNPIIVRGVGPSRPIFDATGFTVDGVLPNPRAVFQVEADYVTLQNLEFRNARNGDNGAGIRVTSANSVTVTNCRITQCDMGIMCDNNSNFVITASEIASNGTSLYDGYSHNFYLGGNNTSVRFCYIHDSLYGQNFKTRGHYTELLYNYIADSQDGELGLVDAAETSATNSHAVMIGNIVISKPRLSGYNSGRFIQFGQDSGGQHNGTLFAFNNTFIAGDGRIQFLSANATGATMVAENNIFYGSANILGTLGGGITGSNNWVQSSAIIPATFAATVAGSSPGFINQQARNFHLISSSGCRNNGLNTLRFFDGTGISHSGLPILEYVNHLMNRPRAKDAQLDIGAYEYSAPSLTAIRILGNDCVLDFTSVPGAYYDLQRAADFASQSWISAITNIPGSDGSTEVVDTNAARQLRLFYRLRSSL